MNNNLTFGSSSSALKRTNEDQGYFIDDYSHLRLSYYQCRDGDDNARDLRSIYDDYSVSTDREHGLECSSSQVSQDAAFTDEESWGNSIISLLSNSPTYSSFEFVENSNETEITQESSGVRTIPQSPIQERNQNLKELPAPVFEESWRTRLRSSFLSSNVILPHPSQVAAAMIASVSHRAGGHQFRFYDRVEPGSKVMTKRECAGSRVMMERDCAGSAVMMERDCAGSSVMMERDCGGSAVMMERDCAGSAVMMERDCAGSAVMMKRDCAGSGVMMEGECDDDSIVFDPKRRSTLNKYYSRLY